MSTKPVALRPSTGLLFGNDAFASMTTSLVSLRSRFPPLRDNLFESAPASFFRPTVALGFKYDFFHGR